MLFLKEGIRVEIIKELLKLPVKIQGNLPIEVSENFLAGMKSTFKPNSTIPILWVIWHMNGIVFCSTHKSRGIFKLFRNSDIDSIKLLKGSPFLLPKIEIISKDFEADNFEVTISDKTNYGELAKFLISCEYEVL
jgi:hypothetical protein